jgi:cell shape-determining protein MreD
MKKTPVFVIILTLAFVQVAFAGYLKFFGITADCFTLALVIASLFFNVRLALIVSVVCGVLKDIFSGNAFAINTILAPLWSIVVVQAVRRITLDSNGVRASLVGVVVCLNALATRAVFWYAGISVPLGVSMRIVVLDSLFTALIAFLILTALGIK